MNEDKEGKEGEVGTHRYLYHYHKMCFKEKEISLERKIKNKEDAVEKGCKEKKKLSSFL